MENLETQKLPYIVINPENCKGCALCISACPVKCIEFSGKLNSHGYNYAKYTGSGCTGCGICYDTCPEPGAITVYKK